MPPPFLSLVLTPGSAATSVLGGFHPTTAAIIDAITTAGATVTDAQQEAIDVFIRAEIAAGRWSTKLKSLVTPLWGVANANRIEWVDSGTGTFAGGMTHSPGYSAGNASTGKLTTTKSPSTLGHTNTTGYAGFLSTQAASGTGFSAQMGASSVAASAMAIYSNGANLVGQITSSAAPATAVWAAPARANHVGIITVLRTSATLITLYQRTSGGRNSRATGTTSIAGNTASTNLITGWARNGADLWSDARLSVLFGGTNFTAADDEAFTANLATLYTALTGNALPA